MKKQFTYILLLIFTALFISCKQFEKPKIEIYLLNKRIEANYVVDYKETENYRKDIEFLSKKGDDIDYHRNMMKNWKFDTISNSFVNAGEFDARISDLIPTPLVSDSEIVSFNTLNNELTIKTIALSRINKIESEFQAGTQFVITVDKKPTLTGYF